MKQIWNSIQTAFIALGGTLGWFLGGADGFLYALIAFVVIDYITGMMCAFADRELSSKVSFKGICRKVIISSPLKKVPTMPVSRLFTRTKQCFLCHHRLSSYKSY